MECDEFVLSPELQSILDDFGKMRDEFWALKNNVKIQEDLLQCEKVQSAQTKMSFEKTRKAYTALEEIHKAVVNRTQRETEELREEIKNLKEHCDHLRHINVFQNMDEERMSRLQDEVEVLKAQMQLQEYKYAEEIELLKKKHSDEMKRHKVLLEGTKKNSVSTRNMRQPKNGGKSAKTTRGGTQNVPCFRWPSLDIEKISDTPADEKKAPSNKKRKLFHENQEAAIDI